MLYLLLGTEYLIVNSNFLHNDMNKIVVKI